MPVEGTEDEISSEVLGLASVYRRNTKELQARAKVSLRHARTPRRHAAAHAG